MKPKNMKTIVILLCLFNLYGIVSLLFLNSAAEKFNSVAICAAIIVPLSYIVIWFFWIGKNWARILVMMVSAMSFFNMYNFQALHIVSKVVIAGELLMACFLLYWLNTEDVKGFFKKQVQ